MNYLMAECNGYGNKYRYQPWGSFVLSLIDKMQYKGINSVNDPWETAACDKKTSNLQ